MKQKLLLLLTALMLLTTGNAWGETDVTSTYLTNADFSGGMTGWTGIVEDKWPNKTKSFVLANNTAFEKGDLDNCAETWNSSTEVLGSGDINQTLSNLPEGVYRLSINVISNVKFYLYASINGVEQSVYSEAAIAKPGKECSLLFVVKETSNVKIGVKHSGQSIVSANDKWLAIDDFKLYREGDLGPNVEVTNQIANWDFTGCSSGSFPGWTIDAENGNKQPYGESCVEYWISNASEGSFDYYQTIAGLPRGKYTLSASMWNTTKANGSGTSVNGECGVYGSSGTENEVFKGVTPDSDGDKLATFTTDALIVTNGTLRLGVKNKTTMGGQWFGVDWIKLYYHGNNVEYYSPAAFTSPSSAEAGTWYAFTVTNAGMYKITSSKAATIYYTQDESDDADDDVSNKTIAADNGFFYQGLSVGTFYFKTSDAGTITIEKSYDDGDDVTSLYITNPSFEDENPITSWACKYYTPAGPNRENSHAASDKTYYAAFWNSNPNVTNGIELYQSVKLPAGYWRLEFDAYNNGDNPNKWSKVQLYFGDDIKSSELDYKSPTDKWQTYSYEFEINTETTANLGVKFIPTTTTQIWENADNFRLTYLYSITPSTEKQSLLDEITKANGIYDSKSANIGTGVFQIPTAAGTTFTAAIATARGVYNNASATAGEVTAATTALATAEETFLSSVNAPDPE